MPIRLEASRVQPRTPTGTLRPSQCWMTSSHSMAPFMASSATLKVRRWPSPTWPRFPQTPSLLHCYFAAMCPRRMRVSPPAFKLRAPSPLPPLSSWASKMRPSATPCLRALPPCLRAPPSPGAQLRAITCQTRRTPPLASSSRSSAFHRPHRHQMRRPRQCRRSRHHPSPHPRLRLH